MKLSLSVRIAEGFLSKEESILNLEQLCELATQAGYDAICMRASQVGVQSPASEVARAKETLDQFGLAVSMVTGDFDVVYNNERGPSCLQDIDPYLALAESMGAKMIRVAIKNREDLKYARLAAVKAADRNVKLVHQCHTLSLFETVDAIVDSLEKIDHPNFGVIYEPANLEICDQSYGEDTIKRIQPWLANVYLQNQLLKADGAITLDTWCRGPVSFDLIQIHDSGGVDFPTVFQALNSINYDGFVTVHQSASEGQTPAESATKTADFLRTQIG